MMKSLKAQLSVAVVLVVLGIMVSYQFQSTKSASGMYQERRFSVISQQVKDLQKQKDDLEKYIAECENKIEEYEKSASGTNGLANSLKGELERVKTLAGLVNVDGPGIIVTVTPGEIELAGEKPVVEDWQLLALVNELNSCGAEAISINGQRFVGTTQIRGASESFIVINDVKMSAYDSFEIKAIGDPLVLEGGMLMTGGPKQIIEFYGVAVDVEKEDNITVPKHNGLFEFKHAKAAAGGN